jgi:hypothetical protein
MKNKKHNKIIEDYDNQKQKHLEKLASQILKKDEYNQKLKEKNIKGDFLKKF